MTEKLYYQDSYIRTFTAVVKACKMVENPDAKRVSEEGTRYGVILDRTGFFPEGGGQYGDQGFLDDVQVLDVYEKDNEIIHICSKDFQIGQVVTGNLNWDERYMKMQQHSAEHIVSGLVKNIYGYDNVGFHLGSLNSTLDFNGEITIEQLRDLEFKANQVVVKNLDIIESWPTAEELECIDFRSKKELKDAVRVITIPNYDMCACCAPQLKKTGEIGIIKLTDVMRYKGGVRVTMLCGFRALTDYNEKEQSVKSLSTMLSVKEGDVVLGVESLREEVLALKQEKVGLEKRLIDFKVSELLDKEDWVCHFENDLKGDASRHLVNLTLERGKELCAVFVKDTSTYRYIIGSNNIDLRPIGKALNDKFQGKGGGSSKMIQGMVMGNEEAIRSWFDEMKIGEKVRENK